MPHSVCAILVNAAQHAHGPEPDSGPATEADGRGRYFLAAFRASPRYLRTWFDGYQDLPHDFRRSLAGKPQIEELGAFDPPKRSKMWIVEREVVVIEIHENRVVSRRRLGLEAMTENHADFGRDCHFKNRPRVGRLNNYRREPSPNGISSQQVGRGRQPARAVRLGDGAPGLFLRTVQIDRAIDHRERGRPAHPVVFAGVLFLELNLLQ